MGPAEVGLLKAAFDSNWIAPAGPDIDAFEREMAAYVGVSAACALSSGTAAVHLALRCLGIGRGDEVFCSSLTFCASANPIVYQGAEPVFVDSDLKTWNLDPSLLEEELKRRSCSGDEMPKAVVVVDLFGQTADYERISAVCERFGVTVISDAAEALGATYGNRKAGSLGKCGVLSFNGNKIITASSGGMLLSNDTALIAQAKFLSTQARDPAPHYEHSVIGYNYRLSNLLAAIGRGQLRVIEERVLARRRNYECYFNALSELPGIDFMPEAPYGRSNRWLTVISVDPNQFGTTNETIRVALEREDIEARHVWKPLHMQPVFAKCKSIGGSVAEGLFARGLCLPSGSALTDEQRERVISIVRAQRR